MLRSTLVLSYTTIDAVAYLAMAEEKTKANREDFIAWCDKYLRFRDEKSERTLTLPGLELYAARCAVVHTYGTEADLHKQRKAKLYIGYANEMLPEVQFSKDKPEHLLLSIRGLVDAINEGVLATIKEWAANEQQRKAAATRLERMLHEVPVGE